MPYEIMKIPYDLEAIFLKRPNRFLGIVGVPGGKEEENEAGIMVHIHDPGRLKELLYPGNRVLFRRAAKSQRKTGFDLIAAFHNGHWILTHSGYHRAISTAVFSDPELSPFGPVISLRPEVRIGESRIDYLLRLKDGSEIAVEVKGCTLSVNGIALFPDAPTLRGRRHLETLIRVKKEGQRAAVVILVFRSDSVCFMPNRETDPDFAEVFEEAVSEGVEVHPLVFSYENGAVFYHGEIPVCEPQP